MLYQLLVLFGFFSLILVLVYWVNRAVVLFDQLISDGQSALVFLEFTALTLPNVIRLVLPIGAFASAVYVTNRLISESEMVVMQSTGFSSFRLARPVVAFGLLVAMMLFVLTQFLVPMSLSRLNERTVEVSQKMAAQLLQPGIFQHPAPGVTVYIREITSNAELLGVLIVDDRDSATSITYTAEQAFLVQRDNAPKLVMVDGQSQSLDLVANRLTVTRFANFAFDIGAFITQPSARPPGIKEMGTLALLDLGAQRVAKSGPALFEAHNRIAQPLLCVVAALIGFATLLLGNFSRFGVWRQILVAVALLILIKSVEGAVTDPVRSDPTKWPLTYLPSAIGLVLALTLLTWSNRPALFLPASRS